MLSISIYLLSSCPLRCSSTASGLSTVGMMSLTCERSRCSLSSSLSKLDSSYESKGVHCVHIHYSHSVLPSYHHFRFFAFTSSLSTLRDNRDPEFVTILESIFFTQVNVTIPFIVISLKNEFRSSTCNLKI